MGSEVVNHSFQFDAIQDSPGVIVLDYRYGDSKIPGVRSDEDYRRSGKPLQSTSVTGDMRRGDELWVKWRVNSENKVYEETVDLKGRLPKTIEDHIIYFRVDGPRLYVYLISPERRSESEPSIGPKKYRHLKVTQIHPAP
jgi:hypothetical protein